MITVDRRWTEDGWSTEYWPTMYVLKWVRKVTNLLSTESVHSVISVYIIGVTYAVYQRKAAVYCLHISIIQLMYILRVQIPEIQQRKRYWNFSAPRITSFIYFVQFWFVNWQIIGTAKAIPAAPVTMPLHWRLILTICTQVWQAAH